MNIFKYIRSQRSFYETETIPLQEGDEFSQYETLSKIDFYWRNKYVNTAWDNVIGDYPFDNVSKYRVLLEARATDFDSKHIEIEPKKPNRKDRVSTMIATKAVHKWMRKKKFAKTLNDICITRPKYGGVLVKKNDDGVHVVPWQNVITDMTEIMSGVIIERFYLTPSELAGKGWDSELVTDAIRGAEESKAKSMSDSKGGDAETQGSFIELYEIHGDITVAMYKTTKGEDYDDEDEYKYIKAHIVVANPEIKETEENGVKSQEEMGIVFFCEKEPDSPYKYLARNPFAGRALGEGVVESLFEHQKWHNFSKTEEMRMLAIAGKKLYWSDDPDVLANIFDEGVDHGTVLRGSAGSEFRELNQIPTGLPMYQSIREEWDRSGDKTTSSFNAKIGEESKSGTPFRAQYLQNVEASSQFEQYREEIGIGLITPIVEDWILPEALKDMANDDELFESFTPQELKLIDEILFSKLYNKEIIKLIVEGKPVESEEEDLIIQEEIKSSLRKMGSKRYISKVKELIENADGSVVVHTTDEARNKAVYFESLSNALQLLAPEDPRRNAIIDRIMDSIGISKEELELYSTEATPTNPNPQLETQQLAQQGQTGAVLPLTG